MTLKIMSAAEIKQAKESELKRDNLRIETTREALSKLQTELNDTEAKFELALANQHVRWIKEEGEAAKRLDVLRKEIEVAEKHRDSILVPIDAEKKKAHDLFIEAERAFVTYTDNLELLQSKLDAVSEREQELTLREQRIAIRERAIEEERTNTKNLARELSVKLNTL